MFERQDVIEREQEMTQGRENCAGSSAGGPGPVLLPPREVQSERRRERAPHRGGAGGVQGPRWGVTAHTEQEGGAGRGQEDSAPLMGFQQQYQDTRCAQNQAGAETLDSPRDAQVQSEMPKFSQKHPSSVRKAQVQSETPRYSQRHPSSVRDTQVQLKTPRIQSAMPKFSQRHSSSVRKAQVQSETLKYS